MNSLRFIGGRNLDLDFSELSYSQKPGGPK